MSYNNLSYNLIIYTFLFIHTFIIWQGTSEDLEIFINDLNQNNLNIRLTHYSSKSKIDFLDVSIQVSEDGHVITDVFRKPTSANSLLHAQSSHPRHLINNVPTGQFLRMCRICSTREAFEKQTADLTSLFEARSYKNDTIRSGYERVFFNGGQGKKSIFQKERYCGQYSSLYHYV